MSHFPEFDAEITDPRSRSVTLRQVASMASGHNRDMMQEALTGDRQEPSAVPARAPDEEPGTVFAYSQPCTYTLAAIIQRVTGLRLSEYLRPRLFDLLAIGDVGWLTWPPGREQGFSGLFARTEDAAKLGQLYLQRGRWGENQLLPERYVEQATRQVDTPLTAASRARTRSFRASLIGRSAVAPHQFRSRPRRDGRAQHQRNLPSVRE